VCLILYQIAIISYLQHPTILHINCAILSCTDCCRKGPLIIIKFLSLLPGSPGLPVSHGDGPVRRQPDARTVTVTGRVTGMDQ
jgi:hypothetical protein